MIHAFGCSAYRHIPKEQQSKFESPRVGSDIIFEESIAVKLRDLDS